MAQCKLCLQDRELKRSHIVPEFMYLGIYDKTPRRFYEMKNSGKEIKSRIEQKGKREYLLCEECESKLSKYEKYADENLYGKNQNGKAALIKQSMTSDGRTFLYEFERFEYHSMKLFLDSLLWRLLVSKSFPTPEYSPDLKEKLRLSIYDEIPLEENENPCLIQSVMTASGKILKGFILSPIEKKVTNEQF
ncbi:hypothetical protein AWW67_00110 [Roseivirga seohaensis]|uniref:HNH endonuclease 5 domain-containing protein n=1 Tax=Roseivirga seohaensis TaxID=1914963 RepID=A0A150Y476_9BACT|nr:hypothetical protein [Roseivirga seohaensis]KYG85685.1 hypothetical protein AWW67_00110 [Roseivirga seohaensis]